MAGIRETFINYLIERGYKVYTKSGLPSTVFDYAKRIDCVMFWECYTSWYQVATNIKQLLVDYGIGGSMEEYGLKGHSAVINALRRFDEFCEEINLVKRQMVDPFFKGGKISPKLVVSPNNSAIRVGDTVVWHDMKDNEDIVKMIVTKVVDAGEISCDAELAKESIGKEVGDVITVNKYKYEIKQIIR